MYNKCVKFDDSFHTLKFRILYTTIKNNYRVSVVFQKSKKMNVERICHDFNPSKFLVHSSLFVFTILFALRLDETITWSYWYVFAPIWFWNLMVLVGSMVGTIVFYLYPHFRYSTYYILKFGNLSFCLN